LDFESINIQFGFFYQLFLQVLTFHVFF
jgi:hypothetical protein